MAVHGTRLAPATEPKWLHLAAATRRQRAASMRSLRHAAVPGGYLRRRPVPRIAARHATPDRRSGSPAPRRVYPASRPAIMGSCMQQPMATLPDPRIDRTSPVPFYFQLVRTLREEIVSGRWKPGERMASELELCDHFGISRTVVRQALSRLEEEGLLRREKGRGTFVADGHERSGQLDPLAGFFQDELGRGRPAVPSQLLNRDIEPLPDWAADALGRPRGSEGATIARLRSVDGDVAMYTVNHVIPEVARTVMELGRDESLYEALERDHGLVVHGGRRVVEAVIAGEKLGRLLQVRAEAPLAFIESVSWDEQRRPFDCFQAWLVTHRMRIELEVSRGAAGGRA